MKRIISTLLIVALLTFCTVVSDIKEPWPIGKSNIVHFTK